MPLPVAGWQRVIAQHGGRHEAGDQQILAVGDILQVVPAFADDPVGRGLQAGAAGIEPFLVAGQKHAFHHREQQSAARAVRALMAVSHVVTHGLGPFQRALGIGIVAIRLHPRRGQEVVIDLVGMVVQADQLHGMGHLSHLEGKIAPHVLASQLVGGRAPHADPARVRDVNVHGRFRRGRERRQGRVIGAAPEADLADGLLPRSSLTVFAHHLAHALEIPGCLFSGEGLAGLATAGLGHKQAMAWQQDRALLQIAQADGDAGLLAGGIFQPQRNAAVQPGPGLGRIDQRYGDAATAIPRLA